MTKRDEAVFAKAFESMKAEGRFKKLRVKPGSRPRPMSKHKALFLEASAKSRSKK